MSRGATFQSFRSACLALAVAALTGCAIREPADPARELGPADLATCKIDWPTRDTAEADKRICMRPGRQRLYVAGLEDLRGKVRPYIWSGDVDVLCRKQTGLGIVCEVRRTEQERSWFDPRVFMFYSSQTPVICADRSCGPPPPDMEEIDGTPMDGVIYRLRPDAPGAPPAERGIIVALRPLSGLVYIRPILNELRDRGWTVIESSLGFGICGVGDLRDAKSDEDLDRLGKCMGELANERLSEWAYGCEAMVELVRQERPALRTKPVVVLGFSAGAIGATTVAARLGDQVKGLVVVGGGVNVVRIAQTSSLSDFGFGVTYHGQKLHAEKLDRLCDAYLKAATLDSYHTAPALSHTPALVLQAADDDIVPVDTGETLYKRLGRPERWVFNCGHEMLFFELGAFDTKIANWIDGNVPASLAPVHALNATPGTPPAAKQ